MILPARGSIIIHRSRLCNQPCLCPAFKNPGIDGGGYGHEGRSQRDVFKGKACEVVPAWDASSARSRVVVAGSDAEACLRRLCGLG